MKSIHVFFISSISPPSVDLAFIADLVEMFFTSMNKYIVANSVRQLADWAYQLFHHLTTKKIVMPGESSQFRDKERIQEMRMEMVQGWISVFLGDYVVCR